MPSTHPSQLLFELSRPGCRAVRLPACDVPQKPLAELLPAGAIAEEPLPLPELSEPDVVRHFVNLSTQNMSVDTNFYPLGSCTMKYNPKRNERLAALPGMADLHPYQPEATLQGCWPCCTSASTCWPRLPGCRPCRSSRPPGRTAK